MYVQALKLLDVMWQCGGELVPDIVSYNTVMKACGNAQQTDKAFEVGAGGSVDSLYIHAYGLHAAPRPAVHDMLCQNGT